MGVELVDISTASIRGQQPASYMDTIEEQKLVSNLLATAQSGAYA